MIISVPYKTSEVLAKKLKRTLVDNSSVFLTSQEQDNFADEKLADSPKASTTHQVAFTSSPVIELLANKQSPCLHAVSSPLDWVSIVFRFPQILSFPRGHGEPVVIAPGYFTDKRSLELLAQLLKYLNYSVYQLELTIKPSDLERYLAAVTKEICGLYTKVQQPISLIGCSFGNLLCAELQEKLPEIIGQVVMIGKTSPLKAQQSAQLEMRTTFIHANQERFGTCINTDMCVQITHALAPSTYKFFQK